MHVASGQTSRFFVDSITAVCVLKAPCSRVFALLYRCVITDDQRVSKATTRRHQWRCFSSIHNRDDHGRRPDPSSLTFMSDAFNVDSFSRRQLFKMSLFGSQCDACDVADMKSLLNPPRCAGTRFIGAPTAWWCIMNVWSEYYCRPIQAHTSVRIVWLKTSSRASMSFILMSLTIRNWNWSH